MTIAVIVYLVVAVLFSVFVVVMMREDGWEMTIGNLFPYLLAVWLWPLTVAGALFIHWNDERKNKKFNAELKRRSQISDTVATISDAKPKGALAARAGN